MVTRVQHVPDHLVAQAQEDRSDMGVDTSANTGPTTRVAQGVTRYIAGQQPTQHDSVTRHVVSHAGTAGGSILDTLDRSGREPSVELVPGDPASRTSVSAALRHGALQRDASGVLQEVQGAATGSEQAPEQQQEAHPDAQHFSASEDQAWAREIAPLEQTHYDTAVASTIGSIVRGDTFENTAANLAKASAIPLEQAQQLVESGYAMQERVVARALGSMGIEGERLQQAYDFMRGKPQQLQDAMQRLVHGRDLSGFRELGVAFKTANTGDLSALHRAGFQTAIDRDTGDVMVSKDGGQWVTAQELAKRGRA